MSEWLETTIGEQATLQRGIDITKATQREGAIPVISSGGVSSFHDEAAVAGPGVVLGRKGVVGSVWFIRGDFWPHDTTLWVKDFHGNDRRFVYYFFKWMASRIATMDVGSANPTLNRNHVHPIAVSWPPLGQQRAIARLLGTLDDKIELNRRMSETLEAMARALFKSWFVDFDPVRAKAEGRDPGLPQPLADLFPARLVDSELGEIPEGWGTTPLARFLKESKTRVGEIEVPEYSSTNTGLELRTKRFTKKLSVSNTGNKLIREGFMVFGLSRRVLNFGLMREKIGSVSAAYKVFEVDSGIVYPDFLERMMRAEADYFYNAVSASSREGQSVSSEGLKHLMIVLPPLAVQNTFYLHIDSLSARIEACRAEASVLTSLRDTLLAPLTSGELRIEEAERFLGAETA